MGMTFPKAFVTHSIYMGLITNTVNITVHYTGTIAFKISADNGVTWDDVDLVSGITKEHNFSQAGTNIIFMAIGNSGAKITNKYKNSIIMKPAIEIKRTG